MNAKYFIAVLATLVGPATAFAQATVPTAGLTRAQVIAEITQARADGTLPLSEAAYLQNQLGSVTAPAQAHILVAQDRDRADAKPVLTAANSSAGAKQ